MKTFAELVKYDVNGPLISTSLLPADVARTLYDFYVAATVALHKKQPSDDDWKAMDAAGEALEKLIGVPEEARS